MSTERTRLSEFRVTRRNLPHWQEPGCNYFVTWATVDRKRLQSEERSITLDAVRFWDSIRWDIYAVVVMPDHVHVLCRPLWVPDSSRRACFTLESIVHSVKSFSAHKINDFRNSRGKVWQSERTDRMLRNEKEFWQKWEYIRNNPYLAELSTTAEDYPWFYQHSGLESPASESETIIDEAMSTDDRRDAGPTTSRSE